MDAGDAETYQKVRPPRKGEVADIRARWEGQVDNIRAALDTRKRLRKTTRIVVSMIRQQIIEGKLEEYQRFWKEEVGVDEVITRKFLSWDDNTKIDLGKSMDRHLYRDLPTQKKEPCDGWPCAARISAFAPPISFRMPTKPAFGIFGWGNPSSGIESCILRGLAHKPFPVGDVRHGLPGCGIGSTDGSRF
ncbi:MAG: hypothetical protein EBZ78_13495 [Verrucomicrobia bacterium]|nr:hypothetical protein [Verrucomicrobiota bacterium]